MLSVIILGFIQGLAEFLPISSSAHLIIFRDLFHIGSNITSDIGMSFDIALHFGTFLAIMVFFFEDFLDMFKNAFIKHNNSNSKMMWYIIVATIPAAVFGVLFEDMIENAIRTNFVIIGLALIVMGVVIYIADRFSNTHRGLEDLNIKDAIIIGCSQIFALVPGFSRSGTTIAAGRSLNLNREDAAKFSFYLSLPIVLGAVVLDCKDSIGAIMNNLWIFIVGILVSFLVGTLCIKYLLKYLKKHDFKIFMWYRIMLGIIVIILAII